MKTRVIASLAAATLGALALVPPAAARDPAVGAKEFARCKACHAIVADDGTEIVTGGKVGPNLYGVVGRTVGGLAGFRYKDPIVAVGESGLVWDEAELAAYMTDPKAWLVEKTGDPAARTGMTFKQQSKQADLAAYLASVVR
ncbi:c-type cytochrome [Pontitalea aquivivens]|uniref:c-type cytochrome n=1 Tax=Pontitalea aquivivens TaxID=3388663 RepID=UPI003970C8E7